MRKLVAIGVVGAAVGYAVVYFALGTKPGPAPESQPPEQTAAPAEPTPARPVVLANVVEVTDIDHLLDPVPGEPNGEPFDPAVPTAPVNALPAAPIPPAAD